MIEHVWVKSAKKWPQVYTFLTTATDVETEQKMYSDTIKGELNVVVMKNDSLELTRYSLDKKKDRI